MCLLWFLGALLVTALAGGLMGDWAGLVAMLAMCAAWIRAIAVAERRSRLHMVGVGLLLLFTISAIGGSFDTWREQRAREQAEEQMFAFGRNHLPVVMESHAALLAKRTALQGQLEQLALLAQGEPRRAEAAAAARTRISGQIATIETSLQGLEARLMDCYLIHLEGGDPLTGRAGQEVERLAADARVVLETVDAARGQAVESLMEAPTP